MLHDFHLESSSQTTFLRNDRETKHGCHVNMFESRYVWHIFTDFTQHQAHCYCPAPWILSSFVRFSSTWVSHGAMCVCLYAVCWHTKDRRQVLSNFSIYCVHVQTFFAFINLRRLNYGIRNHLTSSSTDVKYVETLLLNFFVRRTATNVLHGDRQITAENHRAHPHTHTQKAHEECQHDTKLAHKYDKEWDEHHTIRHTKFQCVPETNPMRIVSGKMLIKMYKLMELFNEKSRRNVHVSTPYCCAH